MRARGFTLLELLVAMAIFAFIGVMAYGGLAAMIKSSEGSREAREQLAGLQRGLRVLDDDMTMLVNRSVRDGLGSSQLALLSGRDGTTQLEFTRTVRVREGLSPAPFSRVRYRLEGGVMLREEWNPPDAGQLQPDQVMRMWEGIEQMDVRFLADGQESRVWPPPNAENMSLPQAVSVRLVFGGGREMTQVMLLPDAGPGNAMDTGAVTPPKQDGAPKAPVPAESDRS